MTAPSSFLRIAVLGTGMMGLPIARRLCQAGHQVHAWNRTRSKAELLVNDGAQVHEQAADAVRQADMAISLLESGPVVADVLFRQGVAEALAPGALFIDMASIQPAEARAHAAQLMARGAAYLDAPVSGGTVGADGPLARAVRQGAICYLDEVVEARKDTTVVLHPLADDRRVLPIERTGELIQAPPEFMLVISYNPGYQNLLKGLKPSTRQRFTALTLDYPEPAVERAILEREGRATPELAARLVQLAQALRRLTDHDLEETASTRLLVMAARLVASGLSLQGACRAAVVDALSDDHETLRALDEVVRAVVGDGH